MKPPYLNALRILICAFALGAEMMIGGQTIELPDTPAGKTLEEFIKAFNTGDLETLKRFHKEHGGDEENARQDMGFFHQTRRVEAPQRKAVGSIRDRGSRSN